MNNQKSVVEANDAPPQPFAKPAALSHPPQGAQGGLQGDPNPLNLPMPDPNARYPHGGNPFGGRRAT